MDAYIWRCGPSLIERGKCKKPAPWRGLEPARVLDGVVGESGFSLGDESIRERLVQVRVHKADWEHLDTRMQGRLKETVRALQLIENALAAAALPGPEARRRHAQALLRDFNSWFRSQQASKRSFVWPHPQTEPGSLLKEKYDGLVPLLREIKQEAAQTRRGFADDRWKASKVAQVNRQLMSAGLVPDRPPCESRHIDELKTQRPTVVAAHILGSAFAEASWDQLRRRKRRRA